MADRRFFSQPYIECSISLVRIRLWIFGLCQVSREFLYKNWKLLYEEKRLRPFNKATTYWSFGNYCHFLFLYGVPIPCVHLGRIYIAPAVIGVKTSSRGRREQRNELVRCSGRLKKQR